MTHVNSTKDFSISWDVIALPTERRIIVRVAYHDFVNHKYNEREFPAEEFGRALDYYAAMERALTAAAARNKTN